MARPRKVNTDVMQTADPVEVVKEETQTEIENSMVQQGIKMARATYAPDPVPELEVEIVRPKVQEAKEKGPTPICDIAELSDSDKEVLIEKRIKAIIEQTQIPYIPALVRYKEPGTNSVPPMFALVEFDHRFVDEGWQFYKTNVKNPYVKDYLMLLQKLFTPAKVYPRLVTFNYE